MLLPVGAFVREIMTPTRANGARITLTRESWPAGPLFDWRFYERERNGSLVQLYSASEPGGPMPRRDGLPGDAPLTVTLTWKIDKDKDIIRLEMDVHQAFNTTPTLEWL